LRNLLAVALLASVATGFAKDQGITSPQAGARTYAQNYKDMVLAECVAAAYGDEPQAAKDAGSSASALADWTYFDMDKDPTASKSLVNRFLARNYFNPLVESEVKGVRFDFLKCLDLYHSKELEEQVTKFVVHPGRTYRQDHPQHAKPNGRN
jgi:hypothetical protein